MRTGTLRFKNDAEFVKWLAATKGIDLAALGGNKTAGTPRWMTVMLAVMFLFIFAPFVMFVMFWSWMLVLAIFSS